MDDVLLGVALDRLDVKPMPAEAADLLLAALDGDAALSAQLRSWRDEPPKIGFSLTLQEITGTVLD